MAAAVPLIVAVPSVFAVQEMPVGRFPVLVRVGVGEPVVVTVKLKAWPAVAVAAAALVIVSPLLTVRVSA